MVSFVPAARILQLRAALPQKVDQSWLMSFFRVVRVISWIVSVHSGNNNDPQKTHELHE